MEPKFGRRSYEDKLVKTQSFTTLIGAGVPPKQAYAISGMVSDPEAAAIAYEAYQEAKAQELDKETNTSVVSSTRNNQDEPDGTDTPGGDAE